MEHSKPGVYNEWDTLGRVIVGRTDDFMFPEFDWVFENYQGISEEVKQGLRNSAGKTYREVDPDGYELTNGGPGGHWHRTRLPNTTPPASGSKNASAAESSS